MDHDQSEVVEDSYRPCLRNFLLNKCKILKVRTGNAKEDVQRNSRKCPLELKRWPIFNLLIPESILQIHTVMIFGDAKAAIIMTRDKMVYALGTNNNGQLGFESKEYKTLYLEKIETLCGKNITKFVCCSQMCSALTEKGKVYFWGINILEQTPTSTVKTPFQIDELDEKFVVDIACSAKYFLFLTIGGMMYVWGEHSYTANKDECLVEDRICIWRSFAMIPMTQNISNEKMGVAFIACGANFNIAITFENLVYSWGSNEYGQLGIGEFMSCGIPQYENPNVKFKYFPHEIILLSNKNIDKVACGYAHTLALSNDGKVYVWGKNNYGQLGMGCERNFNRPALLPMEEKILDIVAAYLGDSSAAFCSDGHIYMWGYWLGEKILEPVVTKFSNIYDVFTYNVPYMTYNFMSADEHEHACETSNILKCLETAFDDSKTSDFIIEIEGKFIHVHKIILIMRNEYFKTMFTLSWAGKNHGVIEQFSYPVYKVFLQYLYTEIIKISTVGNLLELLVLSNVYCETKLKKYCSELIKPRITISNVILVYKTAIHCSVEDLEECSFQFILNNLTIVFLKEFVNLDYDMQLDLTLKVAKAHGFKT